MTRQRQGWCKLAGADPRCSDEAIKHLVRLRFGEKVAAPDPSDTEAMKAFQAQGGVIVVGLSKGEWANVKRAGAVLPAGKICPTAKPYSLDPNAEPVNVIPEDKWTDAIKNIVAYARFLAKELMGVQLISLSGPHHQQLRRLLRARGGSTSICFASATSGSSRERPRKWTGC